MGCFFVFLLSQSLANNCCVCMSLTLQWKGFAEETNFCWFHHHSIEHHHPRDSLKTKIASQEDLSNNLVFRSPWTFHDLKRLHFLQRDSRAESDKRQAMEMSDTVAGQRLCLHFLWWQEVGWEEPSWTPELKARCCLIYLCIPKLRRS